MAEKNLNPDFRRLLFEHLRKTGAIAYNTHKSCWSYTGKMIKKIKR